MNEEQQRIAIAAALGWTDIRRENRHAFGGLRGDPPNNVRMVVPSYCRDLNKTQSAIKALITTKLLEVEFIERLTSVINREVSGDYRKLGAGPIDFVTARPEWLAEALIKTLNLPQP